MTPQEPQKPEQPVLSASVPGRGYAVFFDHRRTVDERLHAAESTRDAPTQDEVAGMVTLAEAPAEDTRIRVQAVRKLGLLGHLGPQQIDSLLALLGKDVPLPVRQEALAALRMLSFSSSVLMRKQPEYKAALRDLVDDGDPSIRWQALATLARRKDDYAQRRLLEGLREPHRALIPPEKAVPLLGYDKHASHYPILQALVRDPPNPATKIEALELLDSDPTAKELLITVLRDRKEDLAARLASANSLESLAPGSFEHHARQIVTSDEEPEDLRILCITSLGLLDDDLRPDKRGDKSRESFERRLSELEKNGPPRLQAAIREYRSEGAEE